MTDGKEDETIVVSVVLFESMLRQIDEKNPNRSEYLRRLIAQDFIRRIPEFVS